MPNWTLNFLTLTFQNEKQRKDFLKLADNADILEALKGDADNGDQHTYFSLRKLLPLIDKNNQENSTCFDLEQSISDWGTKWDTCDCDKPILYSDLDGSPCASIDYNTAWDFPEVALVRIAKKFGVIVHNESVDEMGNDRAYTDIDPFANFADFKFDEYKNESYDIDKYLVSKGCTDSQIKDRVAKENKEVEPNAD